MQVLLRHAIPGTRDLQLIIELADPPVAEALTEPAARRAPLRSGTLQGRSRLQLDSQAAVAYRSQIAARRKAVTDRLQTLSGVEIQHSTDVVMHAVIARVPIEHYLSVRRMSGVKKVYFSRPQRMNLNAAATTLNAAALWTKVSGGRTNAGQGQKIGIIDTGIDMDNAMFADSTLPTPSTYPAGFPKFDVGNQGFVNHKVIVARSYVNLLSSRDRDLTARDEVGHGSFVAGCAAGKLVTAPLAQISGMAPGAFLGNYKIFGSPGSNDFTTEAAVLAAIDDAVNDGMDVINMSLGSLDYVPPSEDPEVDAINNAIAAGVVVCLAAGNEGPDTHSIDSPGAADDAISVGAVWNARIFASQLHVAGTGVPANLQNLAYQNGGGPVISTAIPATPVTDVAALDGNGLACSALPGGSLTGRIALIERGTCLFTTKINNASAAGAVAAVVYNNVVGGDLITMSVTGTSIPAVMVFNADGLAIQTYLAVNPAATISIGVSSNNQLATPVTPVLVSDSSRGPSADFGIKPDLVAVGWSVYSAAQTFNSAGFLYDVSHFTVSQGTSFSTPMVTGAAAALMQLFPNLNPAGIKSLLTNTASQVTINGTTPATIVQAGNGLLNMGNAAAAGAIFSPTNLNFGVQAYSGNVSVTRTLSITNISSSTDQFTISVQPLISGPAIGLSATSTGPLASGASANIDISMQATSSISGGFQGFLVVQSSQTGATYTIPYWAAWYVPDSSRILTVSQSTTGANIYKNLTDALAAANPGNIIEIADSQTYSVPSPSDSSLAGITIATNAQGVPLHGITIRAAAGQTPVIDGSTAGAFADLQIVGLRNVLLQGLTITGGETGVDLIQPSLSIPLSVTIDHCTITNQTDSSTSSGVVSESGGDVDITYSTISGSLSAGVALLGGGQLTMSHTTVQNNGSDGVDAMDANVQLIHSTISGNNGQGVYLVDCSGTLTGNTIAQNTGTFGDGVQLLDGALTITGNTFENNAGAAIALFAGNITTPTGTAPGPGPTVTANRNIIHANSDYGFLIDQAQNLQMDGNLIVDNFQGIQVNGTSTVLLTNNIVARSTGSTFGDGINIADTSNVRIVNCDFYQNRHQGILLAAGATVSAANLIASGNTLGDLAGLSAGMVQNSLIGDGTLVSGNGNITGSPLFTNPDANDFSLGSGSPAIDAGSNAASKLPFLDYNQKFRVASTGSLPGVGTVDMGAIESGATYPLVYPLMVNGFNSVISDDYTTGVAVLNSSSIQQPAGFTAYRPDGALLTGSSNPSQLLLSPGAQNPILGYQLFGLVRDAGEVGGVLASSIQRLTGFFLVFSQDFKRTADGVDVSADTATNFVFPRHESDSKGKATYVLFNPGVNPATVNATLLDTTGATVGQLAQPMVLPPKGQTLFNFSNTNTSSGTVSISSDRPVAGLELMGNTTEIAALRAALPGSEARLYFPHFVVNGGYTSTLGVVNTAGVPVNLTLTAFGNDGSVLGTPAQRTVGPKGQLFESATSLFGLGSTTIFTGYVLVDGDQPGITGFSHFTYENGAVQSTAAVPSESIPQQKLIFSHVAHQVPATSGGNYQTGIALLNPYGTQITYTLKVFDGSGAQVASMTDKLGPHAKVAKVLSYPTAGPGFFTQPIVLGNGHVEVTTDYELLGFELFYTDGLTQLVAVMAQFPN